MARTEMQVHFEGVGMYGYGMIRNVVKGEGEPVHARALWLQDIRHGGHIVFVSAELAFITQNVKDSVMARLRTTHWGASILEEEVMLTATHTHAAPGGFASDALFNVSTGGYHCGVFEGVVNGIVEAIGQAFERRVPARLLRGRDTFADSIPVAWNRALKAHNRNPEVGIPRHKNETHLALDRSMDGLRVETLDGAPIGFINWFGVHATCVDNRNTRISGDNKGHASRLFEASFPGVIAMHTQAKAGDVSPNRHGGRARDRKLQQRFRRSDHGHALATRNGAFQADLARRLFQTGCTDTLQPLLASALMYVPMHRMPVDTAFTGGRKGVRTAPACYGTAFTQGTPIDGKGAPKWLLDLGWVFSFKRERYQGAEGRALCDAHGPKRIAINAEARTFMGRRTDRSLPMRLAYPDARRQAAGMVSDPLVGMDLPVQLLRIGALVLVGLPAEITTVAGDRLAATVLEAMAPAGVRHVIISSYANAYAGYVTTPEEYAAQTYEGGHTLFGPWELDAFRTAYKDMADRMVDAAAVTVPPQATTAPIHHRDALMRRAFPGSCEDAP